jgi:formylglycine-generating enzyme required for sulfatase activity
MRNPWVLTRLHAVLIACAAGALPLTAEGGDTPPYTVQLPAGFETPDFHSGGDYSTLVSTEKGAKDGSYVLIVDGHTTMDTKSIVALWEKWAGSNGRRLLASSPGATGDDLGASITFQLGSSILSCIITTAGRSTFHVCARSSEQAKRTDTTAERLRDVARSLRSTPADAAAEAPLRGPGHSRRTGSPGSQPPPDAAAGDIWRSPSDDRPMVFVPGGSFVSGLTDANVRDLSRCASLSTRDAARLRSKFPERRVFVGPFWIDMFPLTKSELRQFAAVVNPDRALRFDLNDIFEIIYRAQYRPDAYADVPYAVAAEFCSRHGKSLPTGAQWEKAARGEQGLLFPWGSSCPAGNEHAPSPYGAVHMVGVVWQWCDGAPFVEEWLSSNGEPFFDSRMPARGGYILPTSANPGLESLIGLLPCNTEHHSEFDMSFEWNDLVGVPSLEKVARGGTRDGRRHHFSVLPVFPRYGARCVRAVTRE